MTSRTRHQSPFSHHTEGGFTPSYHLEMLHDDRRYLVISRAIEKLANPELSFLELGCGTGVFTYLASPLFNHCTAYERDPIIFKVAKKTLNKQRTDNKVRLINQNIFSIENSDEKFDVILCEMLSTWLIVEAQIPAFQHASAVFAHSGTKFIPHRILNLACLTYFNFDHSGVSLLTPFFEFSGRRRAEPMSVSTVATEIVFPQQKKLDVITDNFSLKAVCNGCVNSLRLSTIVEFAPGCIYSNGDALVPDIVVPLQKSLRVEAGQTVNVCYSFQPSQGLDKCRFEATAKS
jgi:predicted RNA methylase